MAKHYKQGCVVVIDCDERLDAAQANALREMTTKLIAQGSTAMVCDLRKTRVMDSQGLESLLDISAACTKQHGCLRISSANELCRDILRVTGLAEQIETYPDSITAVGAFAL